MRALLVDNLYNIVTQPAETQNFLAFIAKYQFTELTFYTGGPLATRVIPGKEAEFNNLINQVKSYGVTTVRIAIGSTAEMNRVMQFVNTYQAKVDAFWTEYEWWNNSPRDFPTFVSLVNYIRSKGGNRPIGTYIGWVTQEEMTTLTTLVDSIQIHAYVPNGDKTYSKVKGRLDMIKVAKPTKKVSFYTIFSAEWLPPEICNQGTSNPDFYNQMCFMGPWLKANGGPAGAETAYNKAEIADRTNTITWRNYAVQTGFYYYSYTNLRNALK